MSSRNVAQAISKSDWQIILEKIVSFQLMVVISTLLVFYISCFAGHDPSKALSITVFFSAFSVFAMTIMTIKFPKTKNMLIATTFLGFCVTLSMFLLVELTITHFLVFCLALVLTFETSLIAFLTANVLSVGSWKIFLVYCLEQLVLFLAIGWFLI